jgi:hyaluronan synthase
MLYWLLQLLDLVFYDFLHLFLIFGVLCWFIWLLRYFVAHGYKPFESRRKTRPPVSVLVPIFQEEIEDLERNLRSVLAATSSGDEVLAIFDERYDRIGELKLKDPRLRSLLAPPGKRPAIAEGIRKAANPVILVTASDTQLMRDTITEIVKPFDDPEIGGVCGNVAVWDDRGIGAKCYKWAMSLRNLMVYPSLSRSGSVHVLNGECYAMRHELAVQFLDEFLNQRFMGKKFDSGDDGWMTTLLLRHGHKTVFQSTAVAVTEAPRKLRDYVRQQIRWNRNSTRRTLHAITKKWAYKRGFMYPFHLFITLIRAPFWMTVILLALYRYLTGTAIGVKAAHWFDPTWSNWRLIFFILAIIIIRCLRGMPYIWRQPKALIFLPLYAFIAPFLLAPMKIYAMLTLRNARWITRGDEGTTGKGRMRAAQAGMFMVGGALLIFFPVVGLAVTLLDDEACPY